MFGVSKLGKADFPHRTLAAGPTPGRADHLGPLVLGHGLMWLYFMVCCVYFQERMVYLDQANFASHMLNGRIPIDHDKYSDYLTYALPYVMNQLGFGLKAFLIGYSLAFAMIYYAAFIIVAHGLKQPLAALFIPFVHYGYSRASFFWPTLQCLTVISFALIPLLLMAREFLSPIARAWQTAILAFMAALMLFFHPLSLFIVAFIVALDLARCRRWKIDHTAMAAVTVLYCIFKYLTLDEYESRAISKPYWDFFSGEYITRFLSVFFTTMAWPLVALAAGAWFFFRRRQYLILLAIVVFVIGFLIVSNVNRPVVRHSDQYLEGTYLPFVFFMAAPLFAYIVPTLRPPRLGLLLLFALILVADFFIRMPVAPIKQRQQIELDMIQSARQTGAGMVILERRNIHPLLRQFGAHVGIESLLLSGLQSNSFQNLVTLRGFEDRAFVRPSTWRHFTAASETEISGNIPGDPDLLTDDFMSSVSLHVKPPQFWKASAEQLVPVFIHNANGEPLRSGLSQDYRLWLTCQWFEKGGKVASPRQKLPIGMDVYQAHTDWLPIVAPDQPGDYQLRVGFFLDERGAVGPLARVAVVIR